MPLPADYKNTELIHLVQEMEHLDFDSIENFLPDYKLIGI